MNVHRIWQVLDLVVLDALEVYQTITLEIGSFN